MDNPDWDNADGRMVSSVYKDTDDEDTDFILVDEPKSREPEKELYPLAFAPVEPQGRTKKEQDAKTDMERDAEPIYERRFDDKDISKNKAAAMAAYLLGAVGIIIALLLSAESPYAKFHVRQALKLTVCSVMLEIFAAVLAVFGMIPFVGIIFRLLLVLVCAAWLGVLLLRLIAVVQVGDGEAREPAVVGRLKIFS